MKTMRMFAIVPVKELRASKKRLSHVLSREKRTELMAGMLRDVLNALKLSTIEEVLAVSSDAAVKKIVYEYGFSFISPKNAGLNPSLSEAIEYAEQREADAVLILPADLPLVCPYDICKLVELGSEPSTVVLSPSLDGGTNALLLNPPDAIPVSFGKGSFFKHVEEALKKDVRLRFHVSREVMLDIDSEDDLKKLLEIRAVDSKQF